MIYWTDSLHYRCTEPPTWLKITSRYPDLPPEDRSPLSRIQTGEVRVARAEMIDWNQWIPYLNRNLGNIPTHRMAEEIGCAIKTLRRNIRRLFEAGKLDFETLPVSPRRDSQLTNVQLNRVSSLLATGKMQREIAKELGISVTTIKYYIGKWGLQRNEDPRGPYVHYTSEVGELIRKEYQAGSGWTVRVAAQLGTYPGTVHRWAKDHLLRESA